VAVLAIPILDTTLVTVARRTHGRPVSQGGRDHSTHRLVALGLSEPGVALLFSAGTAVLSALGLTAARLPTLAAVALAAGLLLVLGLFGMFLGRVRVYHTDTGSVSGVFRPRQGGAAAGGRLGELRRASGDYSLPETAALALRRRDH
jgi:UDP-GlcNAc:undecaprenyl-phosphate GlcNAc-1-phosphate transferase